VRELHVVGVSRDGQSLLLAPRADARATHAVPIDTRLDRALRGQPVDGESSTASRLSPKEIQARLRAGASVEDVAREAGVPQARVERYAGPVLSERAQVLDQVWEATLVRPRTGRSALSLGAAVAANLEATAFAHHEDARWAAYRRADGTWVARLDVVVRGRTRRAEWLLEPVGHEVSALDSYAAHVGFVGAGGPEPARPTPGERAPAAREPRPKKARTRKTRTRKARAGKVAAKTATVAPAAKQATVAPATKAPAAKKSAAKKSAAKKSARKKPAGAGPAAGTKPATGPAKKTPGSGTRRTGVPPESAIVKRTVVARAPRSMPVRRVGPG